MNTFNVKDYSAKGDGVTDDTNAIRAAIAAAEIAPWRRRAVRERNIRVTDVCCKV